MGNSIERSDIDFVGFINIFDQAALKLNIDVEDVDLKKVLKGEDPNQLMHFNQDSILNSLIFSVTKWDCVPLLNLLKRHNVMFDKVSQDTDLVNYAIDKNANNSLDWLFTCEELFD